ncbi:unnamed protein product [Camellia sinensis]
MKETLRYLAGIAIIVMKETLRYLAGIAGPSGYGSNSTAEQVTRHSSSSSSSLLPSHHLTAIVTGATSGIGAETARILAKRGVRIVIPARDLKKATEVKECIQKESPEAEIVLLEIDLSSLASVKRFCSEFLSLGLPLNLLINNAGKFSQKLEFSEDKVEMTFATNYLGHFMLTELLLEKMVETAAHTGIQGRIINVSSVIHSWVKPETFCFNQLLNPNKCVYGIVCSRLTYYIQGVIMEMEFQDKQTTKQHQLSKQWIKITMEMEFHSYNGTNAYAQSKLANILHTKEIARQLKARNARVTINAVHPGIVKTGIIRDHKGFVIDSVFFLTSKLLKTTPQGASTTCYVALSQQTEGVSGKYFADCNESNCSALANDESQAHMLWKQTRALIRTRLRQPVT